VLLRAIDDDLVPHADALAAVGVDGVAALLRADWLRPVSIERGIGPVLWSETPEDAILRLEWDREAAASALVKMTPTGANALRAMDDPPPALWAYYRAVPDPTLEAEVDAVTVTLITSGLLSLRSATSAQQRAEERVDHRPARGR
jgi:hypothetical protein